MEDNVFFANFVLGKTITIPTKNAVMTLNNQKNKKPIVYPCVASIVICHVDNSANNSGSNNAKNTIVSTDATKKETLIKQSLDLARLSQGLLKGEELTNFIARSYEMIK